MKAAIHPREIVEQANRDGVVIGIGDAPGKLKLRGTADAVARWKPIIAQHKADILPLVEAANDAGRPLPGVLHIAADPFDPADFGLECITHLHQQGIVAALVGDAIHLHGLAEASPAVADEADALLHLHGNDLRAALRAQQRARQAIDQAAGKDCGDRQP